MVFEYEDTNGLYEREILAIKEMQKKIEGDGGKMDTSEMEYEEMIHHYKNIALMRLKSMRWKISELSHIYLRRYRLRDSSLEMFFIPT